MPHEGGAQNFRHGKYVSPWSGLGTRTHDISRSGIHAHQKLTGEFNWDSLENVQKHLKDLDTITQIAHRKADYWGRDYDPTRRKPGSRHLADEKVSDFNPGYYRNPFHSQGLGPESYVGMYMSDVQRDRVRYWDATKRKFEARVAELQGIERAGGQEAYDQELQARHDLSRPLPEAARAAELLRLDRRGGGARGGQAAPSEGRLAARARTAEQRRSSARDQSTGGGGSTRRVLRARNVLEPLGLRSGQASARTLLG